MMHKIISVETKPNLIISATFLDGTIKEYDVKQMFCVYPPMKALEDDTLFHTVQLDTGGFGVSWNDDLDLESETIWEYGREINKVSVSPIMDLAAKLAEARNSVGMTQKQLAEKTGIYQADISKIERGLANPSVSTLQRLADGMGLNVQISFQ